MVRWYPSVSYQQPLGTHKPPSTRQAGIFPQGRVFPVCRLPQLNIGCVGARNCKGLSAGPPGLAALVLLPHIWLLWGSPVPVPL